MVKKSIPNLNAFDNLLEGVQIIDRDLKYVYLNHVALKHSGKTSKELIGNSMLDVYPGIELAEFFPLMMRCFELGTPSNLLNQFQFPDGSIGYFELQIQAYGEFVLIMSMDVTLRIVSEQKLMYANQRYLHLANATSDAIWDWDVNEKIVTIGESFTKQFSLESGLVNMDIDRWKALIHPEDLDEFNAVIDKAKTSIDHRFEVKTRYKKANSFIYTKCVGILIFDEQGNLVRVIGTLQDITGSVLQEIVRKTKEEINSCFSQSTNIRKTLDNVLDLLLNISPNFRIGEFWLVNPKMDVINLISHRYAWANGHDFYNLTSYMDRFNYNQGIPGKVWKKGDVVWLSNVSQHPDFERKTAAAKTGLNTVCGIPLLSKGSTIGVLIIGTDSHTVYNETIGNMIIELTENLGTEIKRKLLEDDLSHIFDNSPNILCLVDFEGNFIKYNRRTYELFGYSENELKEHKLADLLASVKPEEFNSNWKSWIKNKEGSHTIEGRAVSKNGKVLWLNCNLQFDFQNELVNVVANDITEEKKLLDRLNSVNRFAGIGYWVYNAEDRTISLSDISAEIFGLKSLSRTTIHEGLELLKNFSADGILKGKLDSVINKWESWDDEFKIIDAKGEEKWVRMTCESIIDYDLNIKLSGSIQDISSKKNSEIELKLSEQRYSNLFHLSPMPMWVYDLETLRYIQVNKNAIERYGYTEKEFLSMTLLDIRPKSEHQRIIDATNLIKNTQENIYQGKFRHRTKKGKSLIVEIYTRQLILNNRICGLIIGVDRTEKEKFENELSRAIVLAQENERQEIGYELHDNICQLLAACQLSFSMLEGHIDETVIPWKVNTEKMLANVMDEVRNLSHKFSPSFLLDSSLDESLENLLTTFNVNKQFKTSFECSSGIKQFSIDKNIHLNMFRIAQEQLSNIVKHAKATEINIALTIENDMIEMTILDNGIGFDPTKIKRGIGLNNMRRRAEMFYGNMEVISESGKGCSLKISIPLNEH